MNAIKIAVHIFRPFGTTGREEKIISVTDIKVKYYIMNNPVNCVRREISYQVYIERGTRYTMYRMHVGNE